MIFHPSTKASSAIASRTVWALPLMAAIVLVFTVLFQHTALNIGALHAQGADVRAIPVRWCVIGDTVGGVKQGAPAFTDYTPPDR